MTDTDKPAFASAVARLALGLREKEPDAAQMRIYFDAMKDLDVEMVTAAAETLMRSSEWFPKTSEWRAMAQKVEADRTLELEARLRKRMRAGEPPLCGECDDTGWYFKTATNRYARCACRDLRRLEILGRRPMPALPEHAEAGR